MMILRFHLLENGSIKAYQYNNGRLRKSWSEDSTKEITSKIDKNFKSDWSKVDGIYVFGGPGGFSRIRSLFAFMQGLSLGQKIPVATYTTWKRGYQNEAPQNQQIEPVYRDLK